MLKLWCVNITDTANVKCCHQRWKENMLKNCKVWGYQCMDYKGDFTVWDVMLGTLTLMLQAAGST